VADELLPLLRDELSEAERLHLVDMLWQIAGAHSAASELQRKAITEFGRRLRGVGPATRRKAPLR
jgi:uncharacterized tellurite resistance protein B-like protein